MTKHLIQKINYPQRSTVLVFLYLATILFIAISGLDIFFNASHSNKTGVPTFLRFNNLSILLIALVSLWIILRDGIPKLRKIQILAIIFGLIFLITFFKTDHFLSVIKNLILYGRGIVLFLTTSFIIAHKYNVQKIIRAIIWMGIFSAPIAILQEFNYLATGKIPYSDSVIVSIQGISLLRAQAFMSECNFLAFCLGFSLLLLIGNFNEFQTKRWLSYIFIFMMGIALVLTFSRGVILAILIVLAFGSRSNFLFKKKIFHWAVSIGLLMGTTILITTVFYARGDNAIQSRLLLLKQSIPVFLNNPMLGIGIGNITSYTSERVGPHNQFLDIAISGGIFSLLIYLIFLYQIYIQLKEIKQMDPSLGQSLKNCFVYMLIVFMFEDLTSNIVPWLVFSLIDLAYRTKKMETKIALSGDTPIQSTV